jgi:beta-lactamase regulating signal transducer with metallopeptidase domain
MLDTPLIQSIGWALIHFVWQGTVIGIASALALRALAGARPTVRYAVACFSLASMLTVPVIAVLTDRAGDPLTRAAVAAASVNVVPPVPLDRLLPSAVIVWLAGVLLLSVRLVVAYLGVERLKRATRTVDATVVGRVKLLAHRFGIDRSVRVFESTLVRVPTVVGCLRPVILLPASVIAGLDPAYLDAVLAHELAHVRRHDYLVNVLQSLVETLLFYHPAVWWCSRQIRIEREHCCDDMVVEAGGNRVAYAAALAQLEELRGLQPMLSLNASGGRLLDRIRRLLGESPMKERRSTMWTIAAALALVTAIVLTPGRSVVDASELMTPLQPDARQLDYVGETQAALETLARETRGVVVVVAEQASPQPQTQPTSQTKPQPAPRAPVQPRPQPNSQPETQATPQPPQPPLPPSPAATAAPPAPPRPAPLAPAPPLPPNAQTPLAVPAPPAPPTPPPGSLALDPDAIHEAMKGAMQEITKSLEQLREATKDLDLKQEALRQAQAELVKMRVETLASKVQIDEMQRTIEELNRELSKLRVR